MTKRSLTTAPTTENDLFIPSEVLSHIFNSIPLDDVSSRFALLRCGPSLHKLLQPSLSTTVRWINDIGFRRDGTVNLGLFMPWCEDSTLFLEIIVTFLGNCCGSTRVAFIDACQLETVDNYDACLRLFCCLDYIATLYTTTYTLNRATGKSVKFCETGSRPTPSTRLSDVWIRCGIFTARPLLEEAIRAVSNMPKSQRKQIDAICDRIDAEPDERMSELLQSYYNASGNADEKKLRAKCFLITRDKRTLRLAKSDDCLEDVVIPMAGGFMHIYSPPAHDFFNRCFIFRDVEGTGHKAAALALNEEQNADTLLRRLLSITRVRS